jgi:murein DD-endopeptidase MepM/ murein hydrolase activator NlpD
MKKFFLILIVAGLAVGGYLYFRDTKPSQISLTPDAGPVSNKTELLLSLEDVGMGLKQVQVTVVQQNNRIPLAQQDFASGRNAADVQLDLAQLKLNDGDFRIVVSAGDQSIYHFGQGNTSEQTFELTYDTRPPIISLLSKAHNFTKGGSGLVTFNLNEEVNHVGVQFGDHFFPAYQLDSGVYACLFSYPFNLPEEDFVPRVVARDLAGNERPAGIYYRARPKNFRQRRINISDNFLSMKVPEFESLVPDANSPLDIFLYVNRKIRQENRDRIAQLSQQTASRPLWDGAFRRQPNTATQAFFADYRTYYHAGEKIDQQVHLGQDLASVAQAEIVAGNSGKVIWAEYLGIYGLCVVIDHGLGLQSLYAHMSQLDVQPGDTVSRGQIIGRSGNTGLAGGDHLHFGVFVSGFPVQPIEWWDDHWLQDNITSKLAAIPQ